MKFSLGALTQAFEAAGKEAAKAYLAILGLAVLIAFPILCIIGLIYLSAGIAALVGGRTLGAIMFLGFPFLVLLFFSIYAWRPHVWPAVSKALTELSDTN